MWYLVHLGDTSSGGTVEVEIYFENGFTGEPFTILIDDRVVEVEPKTRFQVGLAHVEPAPCEAGTLITIESESLGLRAEHQVSDERFLLVNRTSDGLTIESTSRQPGYV